MQTFLITGAAGFIGSHLADKLLNEGNKVIVVDNFCDFYNPEIKENNVKHNLSNPNYKLYRADIRDRNELAKVFNENKIDVVIHLAAMAGVRPSIDNPIYYQEVNCMGTQNILEEMKAHNAKNIVMNYINARDEFNRLISTEKGFAAFNIIMNMGYDGQLSSIYSPTSDDTLELLTIV